MAQFSRRRKLPAHRENRLAVRREPMFEAVEIRQAEGEDLSSRGNVMDHGDATATLLLVGYWIIGGCPRTRQKFAGAEQVFTIGREHALTERREVRRTPPKRLAACQVQKMYRGLIP